MYDPKTTDYVSMILYSTGLIELYCEKLMKIDIFTNKYISNYIESCNRFIRQLNKKNIKFSFLKNAPHMPFISFKKEIIDVVNKFL